MESRIKDFIKNTKQWEAFTYLAAGGLTTLINIIVYYILCNYFLIENLISNIFAWTAAVLFAFAANDLVVFSRREKKNGWRIRFLRFIGARLVSLAIDEAGMLLLVELLHINNMFSKIIINIMVVIINYFLSKKIIFN